MQQESFCQFSPLFPPLKTLPRCLQAGISKPIIHGMKLLTVFVTIFCLHVSAKTDAQQVTLNLANVTLEKVFEEIQKQTSYNFFFQEDALAKANKVTIKVKNATVKSALDFCSKDQPFTFEILDKSIVVKQKEETPIPKSKIPPITITGKVVDDKGEPIAGATITIKGTGRATSTDVNGEFSIPALEAPITLIISGTESQTQELIVTKDQPVLIRLASRMKELDQLVFVAYGTTTKRLNTGNVTTVKAKDIDRQPVSNPLLALQGRVPGLFITQDNGLPGSSINIKIRGQNSLTKGNTPLYVIDGVPYTSQTLPTLSTILGRQTGYNGSPGGSGNPLNYIAPGDIESIDVLKDADATSIYGSRAANGAILITTKKGKAGRIKTELNLQTGWGKVTRMMPLLNTQQYLEMRHEAFDNDGLAPGPTDFDINGAWDTTKQTDWQKELIGGTAKYSNVRASISGGTSNISFLAGAIYNRETTVFPGSLSDTKGSAHFSINATSTNRKFNFQLSGSYLADQNRLINTDLTASAIALSPNAPKIYKADGSLNWSPLSNGTSTWLNPLAYINQGYTSKTNNLISNAQISYTIIDGLAFKTSFGYTSTQTDEIQVTPLSYYAPELRPYYKRSSSFSNGAINSWIIEPQITYKFSKKRSTWETLVGSTLSHSQTNRQKLSASGFNSDLVLEDIFAAGRISADPYINTKYRYVALFARANYNWSEKYILNLTGRRDGSSRFGKENRFHDFWSMGAAWIFTREKFIQEKFSFLSFGKLRGSTGTTGSEQIGDYQYLSLYNPVPVNVPYQGATSILPSGLPNPHLQWEETRKTEFALDLGFLQDKILLSTAYYKHRSSNQLNFLLQPSTTGFGSMLQNFGALIQNDGWEFSLLTENIKDKKFSWTTSFNLSLPRNKLVSYPNLATSPERLLYIIGHPLSIAKSLKNVGIDPQTGLFLFLDKDGKPTSEGIDLITDRTLILNTAPRLFGGLQNNIQYRAFEIDFLFQFVKQTASSSYALGVFPGYFYSDPSAPMMANQPTWVLDRWQQPGDIKTFQKFSASYPSNVITAMTYAGWSDLNTIDASYIRLKNISVTWRLPISLSNKMGIQSCKIFTTAQNLLTITNYKGLDPESLSILTLPPLRLITMGAQIAF